MKKLITAIALVASFSAQAEFYSGNDIHRMFSSGNSSDRLFAMGFVAGVVDVYQDVGICVPNNVTLGQVNDIFKQWLIFNPEKRHFTAQELVREAISMVYPCQNKGRNL